MFERILYRPEDFHSKVSALYCRRWYRGFILWSYRYISKFPAEAQRNFGVAVDNWQAEQILKEYQSQTVIDLEDDNVKVDSEPPKSLLGLPSPHLQLLFGSANDNILDHTKIRTMDLKGSISAAVVKQSSGYSAPISPNLVKLGLLPSLILLATAGIDAMQDEVTTTYDHDSKIRHWARTQISACGGKPIKPLEWVGLGLAEAWESLLPISGADDGAKKSVDSYDEQIERWKAALAIIESKTLHPRTLEEFVLGTGNRNALALLASRIADKTPGEGVSSPCGKHC